MYLKLVNQKELIGKAIKKAGSSRKLAKILSIPSSSLDRYYLFNSTIPRERVESILSFLQIKNFQKYIEKEFEMNFRQKLGGLRCVEVKKKKGTFEGDMKNIQKKQSEKLKKWHSVMKKERPEEYYNIQYSRFKKIGGYKFKTKKGEKVKNIFEKQVADILFDLGIDYEYELLVNVENRYFFPDFIINNKIIIEVTAWKGESKAYKLQEKINFLKKKYKIKVVIPKHLYSYYKILNYHLICGLDDFASVAQTFSSA